MLECLGDPHIEEITEDQVQDFFIWLYKDYVPRRANGDNKPLNPSTVEKAWTALRSLYNCATEELELAHGPDTKIKRPKYPEPEIIPFTDDEISALLKACEYTKPSKNTGKSKRKSFVMRRPSAKRDLAIVAVLLETGVRASELCRMNVGDLNLQSGEIRVAAYGTGRKTKPRTVIVGKRAKKYLWRYLAERDDPLDDEPLFLTSRQEIRMNRNSLRHLLRQLGDRAEVKKVYPHRFRHTMGVMYLRNGEDVFSLKRLFGHSSFEMVNRYLTLSNSDLSSIHKPASPLDRLKR
jgi:site-specific recombinase XerD